MVLLFTNNKMILILIFLYEAGNLMITPHIKWCGWLGMLVVVDVRCAGVCEM